MGVDFGGADAGMTQHDLHGTEVGTVLDKLGGEGVAKAVGTNVFVDAGPLHRFVEEFVDKLSGEVLPSVAEEDIDFFSREGSDVASDSEDVGGEHVEGVTVDGDPPLFVSFAYHMESLFVDKEVGEPKVA